MDDERLEGKQFIIPENYLGDILGFGRIKKYLSCYELGTVGIVPHCRGRGLGRKIIEALIAKFPSSDVWITTDLNGYFEQFGFLSMEKGPLELTKKISSACGVKGRLCVKIMLLRRKTDRVRA